VSKKKRQETEHAEPVAQVAGKRFRGAGAPVNGLKGRPKREPGYEVPREIIHPRELNLRPMAPCPYQEYSETELPPPPDPSGALTEIDDLTEAEEIELNRQLRELED
jgi:hypothetical protein